MPPTVLGEMIHENVELLDRSARAAGAGAPRDILRDQLLDMLRATEIVGGGIAKTWELLNESLDEGMEEGDLSDVLRTFLGPLPVFQALCRFLHGVVSLRTDIPENNPWLERLNKTQRLTEEVLTAGRTLLASVEAPEPPLDAAALLERERRCEEAQAWIKGEDLLVELERGGKP